MKILSYNIGNGAHGTFNSLVSFVNLENPDILCLQEANGWKDSSPSYLDRFISATKLKYYQYGNSNTDFDLIILSKMPIIAGKTYRKNFWHSAVQAEIPYKKSSLHIWNIHLNPRAPSHRLSEIQTLLSIINNRSNTVVTGDLNSVCSTDPYPPNLLEELLDRGITKFGTDRLSFNELSSLKSSGLSDTCSDIFEPTVPTPHNNDPNHAIKLRLDYFLVTEDLTSRINSVETIENIMTDEISDHYPLRVVLN